MLLAPFKQYIAQFNMKTTSLKLYAYALLGILLCTSCDTDDDQTITPPDTTIDDMADIDDPADSTSNITLTFTQETEEDQIGQFAQNAMVEYDGNVWVVGGHQGYGPPYFTNTNQVWRSENGAAWLSVSSGQFPARSGHTLNVIDGKMIMIGGINSDTGETYSDIWSSTDGLTWVLESDTTPLGDIFHHTVTEFNGRWYLIYASFVYSSTNGIDWTFEATTDFAASNYQETVVLNDMLYVLGGLTSTTNRVNEVWGTTDGVTWEEVILSGDIFTPRINHTVTAYNGKAFIIGGRAGTTIYREIFYSEDMENWTSYPLEDDDEDDGIYSHNTLLYEDALWIFGGYNSSQALSAITSIQEVD